MEVKAKKSVGRFAGKRRGSYRVREHQNAGPDSKEGSATGLSRSKNTGQWEMERKEGRERCVLSTIKGGKPTVWDSLS